MKELRKKRGWTQDELAAKCGLTGSRLSQIETGANDNLSLGALLRLQHAFGLDTLEALLGPVPSAGMASVSPWDPRGT